MRHVLAVALAAIGCAVCVTTAAASAPVRFQSDFELAVPLPCQFPAQVEIRLRYSGLEFYDASGDIVRVIQHTHHVLTYTNLATGYHATALLARTHFMETFTSLPDGSFVVTGEIRGLNGHLVAPGQGAFATSVGRFAFRAVDLASGGTFETATLLGGQDNRGELAGVCSILAAG